MHNFPTPGARLQRAAAVLLAVAALAACNKKDYTAFALTSTNRLIEFQTNKPGDITSKLQLNPTASGAQVVQLAYRPSNQTLYCITGDNEVCTLDVSTGAITTVGTAFLSDSLSNVAASFDPVNDVLRVTATDAASSSGRINLRIDPGTGTLIRGVTTLDYNDSSQNGTPQINALAYTNPLANASSTTLYGLDITSQNLVRIGDKDISDQTNADLGEVRLEGSTGITFTSNVGFAIAPQDGTAFAALGNAAQLYTIDLDNGSATLIGPINESDYTVVSLVIAPNS